MLTGISDEIIRKASDGDLRSFEAIYKATSGFVYNVALRVVNNPEDAKEVAQEVFLNMYHKLKGFRFESSLKTWVYRITVNSALNSAQKTARTRGRETEYQDVVMAGEVTADARTKMDEAHCGEVIEKLLETIDPEQRACVVLRGIEGLSYQEIAETLKININTVRSRLKRAREKLLVSRKKVADEYV